MEQKTIVALEHELNGRRYQLNVAPDAPLLDLYYATYAIMTHVLKLIQMEHEKQAPKVAEPEKESDGVVSQD